MRIKTGMFTARKRRCCTTYGHQKIALSFIWCGRCLTMSAVTSAICRSALYWKEEVDRTIYCLSNYLLSAVRRRDFIHPVPYPLVRCDQPHDVVRSRGELDFVIREPAALRQSPGMAGCHESYFRYRSLSLRCTDQRRPVMLGCTFQGPGF